MKFKQQFAAVFAATDGKNHIELQRFLLAAGDDRQRYSQPVRNLFNHIASGLRDSKMEPVDLQDIGPSDIHGLKFLSDHLRKCDILPLAALGSCLFGLVIEAETRQKQQQKQLQRMMLFGSEIDENESKWTNNEDYGIIPLKETSQKLHRSGSAPADVGMAPDNAQISKKPDGFKRTAQAFINKWRRCLRSLFN